MPRWLYSLLLYVALPFVLLRTWMLGLRHPANSDDPGMRLARGAARRADSPLWLHAASVGEVRALAALVHVIEGTASPLLITVGTPTGCARARELFGTRHEVRPAPWDLPGAARRFIDAVRPRGAVFVETELWPNLIAAAQRAGVPLVLLSARVSSRSSQRYRRFARSLMRSTVQAFAAIGAQGEADRARFIELGAAPDRVTVTGNLKFDLPLAQDLPARGRALRARWAPGRPLWVAGSTHPGEEEQLLAAQRRLVESARGSETSVPLLAFAPRHPARFAAVADWLAGQDLRWERWSGLTPDTSMEKSPEVLLIDAMGVLSDWYAAADVAYVGGSLVDIGGHNLLEPAVLGRPVLTGPHFFNAPDVARCLVEAGGARVVHDAGELASALASWLADPAARSTAGSNAAAAVTASRGAARRSRALLTALGVVPEPAAQPARSAQ
jgi:3-deoxy-D-manno-octulosonic-acid transferase